MYKTLQLWVGPGSRAAEEKQFFDSHLAPFYRIEQVSIFSFDVLRSFPMTCVFFSRKWPLSFCEGEKFVTLCCLFIYFLTFVLGG